MNEVSVDGSFTCPMHPEVVQDEPGSCPICGMALEARHVGALGEEDNSELLDMSRRFWLATISTVPLVFVAMGDLLRGAPVSQLLSAKARIYVELGSATPVCLWAA